MGQAHGQAVMRRESVDCGRAGFSERRCFDSPLGETGERAQRRQPSDVYPIVSHKIAN